MTATITTQFYQAGDKRIAELCLDNPKALNAQTATMTATARSHLSAWQDDETVCAIILRGTGDKAFCAGGDIKGLYYAATQKSGEQIEQFFASEYGLIADIAHHQKPIIAWGNGIVMGGGLGLLAAARHKVVTDSTLMSMPEVSIGLFPDAGATWFLPAMMGKVGLFLGLTGARWTAADACVLGLGEVIANQSDYPALINALITADWHTKDPHGTAAKAIAGLHRPHGKSDIVYELDTINALMAGDLPQIDTNLCHYNGDSPFIKDAISRYKDGSAITKALTYQLYHYGRGRSLKECLALETKMAVAVCQHGDFCEGVRALLIDKDKNPAWQYQGKTLSAIDLRIFGVPLFTAP